jgi:hypothetical protein
MHEDPFVAKVAFVSTNGKLRAIQAETLVDYRTYPESEHGTSGRGAGQYFMVEDGTGLQVVNDAGEAVYVWLDYADIVET